jgi:hypothetical protein
MSTYTTSAILEIRLIVQVATLGNFKEVIGKTKEFLIQCFSAVVLFLPAVVLV